MEKALVKNAGDPHQVREAAKKERFGRKEELADLQAVLATGQGRRVLWRFIEKCQVLGVAWDPDERQHCFNTGRQEFGKFLVGEIEEATPHMFSKMMNEAKERANV